MRFGGFVVEELEKKFIELGNALARSLGHNPRCPKASHAVPCSCGVGSRQAQALSDWDRFVATLLSLKDEIKEHHYGT
jgi:hypothetical protein